MKTKTSNEVKLATVCMHSLRDKSQNLQSFFEHIDQASKKGADLVVFPEAALQGYPCVVEGVVTSEQKEFLYRNAETIPGPATEALIQKSVDNDIYIIFGMIERSNVADGAVLYNSAVLIGPEGLLGIHRKVHPALEEHHVFKSGTLWQVFETRIGKIGIMICYDKSFPESARELTLQGARIIAILNAWAMLPEAEPTSDKWGYANDLYEKTRALENQVYVVSSGMVGLYPEDGIDFYGHSRIIDPTGQVLVDTGHEEGQVIATVDVTKGILNAWSGFRGASNLINDRKPDTYKIIGKPYPY